MDSPESSTKLFGPSLALLSCQCWMIFAKTEFSQTQCTQLALQCCLKKTRALYLAPPYCLLDFDYKNNDKIARQKTKHSSSQNNKSGPNWIY
jgi:hypothetical protein